jgi:2-keto-4-pentenoate hydratase/2-oxohepta-3-ene-1,7-dioic acid hydratase in catechol pathway
VPISPGDIAECRIEGIGTLINPVVVQSDVPAGGS